MINGGVSIISNSWAYCEDQTGLADVQSIDSILQSAAASGISVFNGSGDHGTTCLDGSANTIGVPADSPHATAVGGTSVNGAAGDIYAGETWWNSAGASPPGGQGGYGVSRFFARPAYPGRLHVLAVPLGSGRRDQRRSRDRRPDDLPGQRRRLPERPPLWRHELRRAALGRAARAPGAGARRRTSATANLALYPLAGTAAFHGAASMGSDFAHVGLGSGDFDRIHLALAGLTAGGVDASTSNVTVYMTPALVSSPGFSGIPADGTSSASVVVTLRDAGGNLVGGKTATLSATAGSHVVIAPASAVTSALNGSACSRSRTRPPRRSR